MKTLMLLRHAKSGWDDASLPDHERPLNARGRDTAQRLCRHFAGKGNPPALALCSTAHRTRETLELITPGFASAPQVRIESALYLAEPGTMIGLLQALPDEADPVLLIGHNPGIATLANRLVRRGDPALRASLAVKFPTGALAVVELPMESWRDLAPGTLVEYSVPRDLPA